MPVTPEVERPIRTQRLIVSVEAQRHTIARDQQNIIFGGDEERRDHFVIITQVNRVQGRNGFGIKVAKLVEGRGALVGGLIVSENDEVLVVMQSGKVVRTNVSEVPAKGRDTMGVIFAKPGKGDSIIGIARNQDRQLDEQKEDDAEVEATEESVINSEVVDTQENKPTTASTDVDGGN